jgi:acetyl esterase/lipase
MNVYLLRYSTKEKAANSAPLIEAALAIKYVREHAEEHNSDPNKVFIVGFSAGGHLAASSGILWDLPEVRDAVGVTDGSAPEGINKPNGMILGYPVITMTVATHGGTRNRVCGSDDPSEEMKNKFSLELHVKEDTPPVFLWHTFNDKSVNIRNALLLMEAYAEAGVPFEAHIYPNGPHGLALCNEETWKGMDKYIAPEAEDWIYKSIDWIKRI